MKANTHVLDLEMYSGLTALVCEIYVMGETRRRINSPKTPVETDLTRTGTVIASADPSDPLLNTRVFLTPMRGWETDPDAPESP